MNTNDVLVSGLNDGADSLPYQPQQSCFLWDMQPCTVLLMQLDVQTTLPIITMHPLSAVNFSFIMYAHRSVSVSKSLCDHSRWHLRSAFVHLIRHVGFFRVLASCQGSNLCVCVLQGFRIKSNSLEYPVPLIFLCFPTLSYGDISPIGCCQNYLRVTLLQVK